MTKYEGENTIGGFRFIRVESGLFIAQVHIKHNQLASQDEITDVVWKLREENPDQVDAGFIAMLGETVRPAEHSDFFRLPVKGSRARDITIFTLEKVYHKKVMQAPQPQYYIA